MRGAAEGGERAGEQRGALVAPPFAVARLGRTLGAFTSRADDETLREGLESIDAHLEAMVHPILAGIEEGLQQVAAVSSGAGNHPTTSASLLLSSAHHDVAGLGERVRAVEPGEVAVGARAAARPRGAAQRAGEDPGHDGARDGGGADGSARFRRFHHAREWGRAGHREGGLRPAVHDARHDDRPGVLCPRAAGACRIPAAAGGVPRRGAGPGG